MIHLQGATPLATFTSDFLKDSPAITKHRFGKGLAYYLGTELDQEGLTDLLNDIFSDAKLKKVAERYLQENSELSVTVRQGPTHIFLFLLNHTNDSQQVQFLSEGTALLSKRKVCELTLAPMEVEIIKFAKG
nr:beta-galactosidase trimerization domain-containing protein [Enterococcus gallinarum]